MEYCLTNLSFFDTVLVYYYTNLNLSIICCLFFCRYISLFWYLYFILMFLNAIPLKHFVNEIPLDEILLRILKYLRFYQLFYYQLNHQLLLQFFELPFLKHFCCICCRFFSTTTKFLTILITRIFSNFSCMCTNIFSKWQKSIALYTYFISKFNWITHFYNSYII